MPLSKRRLESYRRAEVVAQAARQYLTAKVVDRDPNKLLDTILDWTAVTGKQKYAAPVRRGRS